MQAAVVGNQAAVAGLLTMGESLVPRLEDATPEYRQWAMKILDVGAAANHKGFSVSLRVPPQATDSMPGGGNFEANFLSCRPKNTLLQSGETLRGFFSRPDDEFRPVFRLTVL